MPVRVIVSMLLNKCLPNAREGHGIVLIQTPTAGRVISAKRNGTAKQSRSCGLPVPHRKCFAGSTPARSTGIYIIFWQSVPCRLRR